MANSKVSDLSSVASVGDNDLLYVVVNGDSRKVTKADFLQVGSSIQAFNSDLSVYAGNALTAAELNQLQNINSTTITSVQWSYLGDITSFGASLINDANASSARLTLGLGSIATQPANNVNITGGSIAGITDLAVAHGGTGASTASGARTNLGLGTAAVADIAGTVSESGGTPTGDIIESGFDSNGGYVKFADGTLMVRNATIQGSTSADTTWTFPNSQAFLNNSLTVTATVVGSSTPKVITINNRTTTSVDFSVWNLSGSRTNDFVCIQAAGRWYS